MLKPKQMLDSIQRGMFAAPATKVRAIDTFVAPREHRDILCLFELRYDCFQARVPPQLPGLWRRFIVALQPHAS